jgi:hypothetical protein
MLKETPVIEVGQSKTPEKLTKTEKRLAGLMLVLGVLLTVGTLAWFAGSTDGTLKSKETVTKEPVGPEARGEKSTTETDYADTVVIFALTLGGVLILAGAFFGRIREIRLGGAVLTMGAPEEKRREAQDSAAAKAREAAPEGKKDEAAAIARTLAGQQVDLAYLMAPVSARASVPEAVAEAAALTAVRAVE